MKATRSTPSSKSAGTPKITIKGAKQAKQAKEDDEVASEDDDDDDMESSFLQFWFVLILESDQSIFRQTLIAFVVQCARNKSLSPTPPFSIALRGKSYSIQSPPSH